jgi:hypothetical protein
MTVWIYVNTSKQVGHPEHIKVFEFSPSLTVEEAKAGIEHVKKIWGSE